METVEYILLRYHRGTRQEQWHIILEHFVLEDMVCAVLILLLPTSAYADFIIHNTSACKQQDQGQNGKMLSALLVASAPSVSASH